MNALLIGKVTILAFQKRTLKALRKNGAESCKEIGETKRRTSANPSLRLVNKTMNS